MAKPVHSIVRFLRKPLFGTRVIPRGARVDPALFPEEEYPVCCDKCGYLLRGLTSSVCPECGTLFDRGQLLVRQYVHGRGRGIWKREKAWRWAAGLFVTSIVLDLAPSFAFSLSATSVVQFLTTSGLSPFGMLAVAATVKFFPKILMLASIVLCFRIGRQLGQKKRAISAAVEPLN